LDRFYTVFDGFATVDSNQGCNSELASRIEQQGKRFMNDNNRNRSTREFNVHLSVKTDAGQRLFWKEFFPRASDILP